MLSETKPARIVMIVPNGITADSRVQKVAETASQAGYDVVVLGVANEHHTGSDLVGGSLATRLRIQWVGNFRDRRRASRRVARADNAVVEWALRARLASRWTAVSPFGRVFGPIRYLYAAAFLKYARWRSRRVRKLRFLTRVRLKRDKLVARGPLWLWRMTLPAFVDFEDAFVPAIVALEPDIIHVHDAPLLPAGYSAARVLRRVGRTTRVVYDAHEWWPGVGVRDLLRKRLTVRLEQLYAKRVDAVMTVGPLLAQWLEERHRLRVTPTVVENCPSAETEPAPERFTLRTELGLSPDVPLMVYSGSIGPTPARGLGTAVEALPALRGVHLAIVCSPTERANVEHYVSMAEEMGVADRIHVSDYVPPAAITWYLASADIGLAPFLRTASHDSALATKVSEYIIAGLPVLGSDCTAMAEFLRSTGCGEVFTAQDSADFVRAARLLLADLPAYRSAITPEIRRQRTWEAQEPQLLGAYAELLERSAPVSPAPETRRVVVVGGDPVLTAVVGAVQRVTAGSGTQVDPLLRFRAQAGEHAHRRQGAAVAALADALHADTLVYLGAETAFKTLGGAFEEEVGLFRSRGVRVIVVLDTDEPDSDLGRRLVEQGCEVLADSSQVVMSTAFLQEVSA